MTLLTFTIVPKSTTLEKNEKREKTNSNGIECTVQYKHRNKLKRVGEERKGGEERREFTDGTLEH